VQITSFAGHRMCPEAYMTGGTSPFAIGCRTDCRCLVSRFIFCIGKGGCIGSAKPTDSTVVAVLEGRGVVICKVVENRSVVMDLWLRNSWRLW